MNINIPNVGDILTLARPWIFSLDFEFKNAELANRLGLVQDITFGPLAPGDKEQRVFPNLTDEVVLERLRNRGYSYRMFGTRTLLCPDPDRAVFYRGVQKTFTTPDIAVAMGYPIGRPNVYGGRLDLHDTILPAGLELKVISYTVKARRNDNPRCRCVEFSLDVRQLPQIPRPDPRPGAMIIDWWRGTRNRIRFWAALEEANKIVAEDRPVQLP